MLPIRATPSSDGPSDQSGGTPARTARRSYGTAQQHCELYHPPVGLCRAWALATETRPAVPVPGSAHCRRPHPPVHVGSCGDQRTGRGTPPLGVAPPRRAAPPPFDSHRWHWLPSLRPPTAWPGRPRLGAPPSRICRDPRGWGQSARPFFCGLLRAIEQHLLPVDPLQSFVALGQLLPRPAKSILLQPDRETPLNRFGGRKAWGQHLPPDPRHQDIEHGMPTLPVVVGRTPIATPDHRRENRLKERPHVLGHLTGKISQLHALLLPLCFLDPVRITQGGGFVSQTLSWDWCTEACPYGSAVAFVLLVWQGLEK